MGKAPERSLPAVFDAGVGGIAVSGLLVYRLAAMVTLKLRPLGGRLGCLVLPPCSLHQSVAVLRTKVLQCLSSCSEKLSSSSYTGNGRGAVHRGDVTCLYLRAAPSEIDA